MIFDVAASRPDELALDDLTRTRSWSELLDRALRAGRLLRDGIGIAEGGHAAMVMGNRVEFLELALGALLSGVWLTPVNWHLTPREIAFVLQDSGADVVFADPEHEVAVQAAVQLLDRDVAVIGVGDELDRALAAAPDGPFGLDGPAGGTMFYTSGTTGTPKGVKRATRPSVREQLAAVPVSGGFLGLDGGGPHLVTGPLYHAAPVGFASIDLHQGAPLVVMPRWDPVETLRLIERHGVRNSHLVPTMFVRLLRLDDEERARHDLSSLHVVLHGAAPIAPAVKQRMIEWWGDVIVEYWGASEGGVVTLVGARDWLAHPGTVGRPIPTYEVFAIAEDGERLPPGGIGALYCRNTATTDVFEYHNDAAKTEAAFLAPGTYTIGDIGWVDDEGYVHLSDRASHVIISGGVNIYPAEIEQVLIEHPAVADVAVFGIPDPDWGEEVKAAVAVVDGVAPTEALAGELLAFARERLAGFKVPRSVDFHPELPREPTGKLATRRLREPYWAGRERAI